VNIMLQDNSTLPASAGDVPGVDAPPSIQAQAERSAAVAAEWGQNAANGDELLRQVLGEALILFRHALADGDGFEELLKKRKVHVTNRAGNRIAVGVIRLAFAGVSAPAHARVKSNQSMWASCVQGLHQHLPKTATAGDATAFISVKGCGVKETARAFRDTRKPVAREEPRWKPGLSKDAQIQEFIATGKDLGDLHQTLTQLEGDNHPRLVLLHQGRFRMLDLSVAEICDILSKHCTVDDVRRRSGK